MTKKVIFVIGMASAGKSTYIRENLRIYPTLDLFDYQANIQTLDDIWQSYVDLKDDLIKLLETQDIVVCEHTLLKAERRAYYIEALKEVYPDIELEVILINPTLEEYKRNVHARHPEQTSDSQIEYKYNSHLELLEIPTLDEGFKKVEER